MDQNLPLTWKTSTRSHGPLSIEQTQIYSVTTTAKANGLNPRLYVEWLLTEMPNAGELTDEVVDSFLPWSDRVPESCKLDPAAAEKAKEMPDDFIINIDPDAFDDEMANNAEEGL